MTFYKSFTDISPTFLDTFLQSLLTIEDKNIKHTFLMAYSNIYNSILTLITYNDSSYKDYKLEVQTNYTSIQEVQTELLSYVCSLQPIELLTPPTSDYDSITFKSLFSDCN